MFDRFARSAAGLRLLAVGLAAVLSVAFAGDARAQATCDAGSLSFNATGVSRTLDVSACDELIDDFNTWGGFFTTSTGDAYSFYGLGVDDFGAPADETFETSRAVYRFNGNLTTDIFTITLVSLKPGGSGPDTLSLFMCPGPEANQQCLTTQTTTVTVTLPPPPDIATTTLTDGQVGVDYSQAITTTGGVAPYSYSLTLGALPAGLTLSSGGTLSGRPTAGGVFTFTVQVSDQGGRTDEQALTLTIAAPTLSLTPETLTAPQAGAAYSQTVTTSGGTAPYTYAVTAGALPAGLTLSSAGVVAGTPTASGPFTFTVQSTDASTGSGPYSATREYTVNVAAATIVVSPTALPAPTIGAAYSQAVTASGGTAPYSFAVTAGALPSGLTLSSGGVISGAPTQAGPASFTITATDSTGGAGPSSGARSYSVSVAAPVINVAPPSLPNGTVGFAYSQTFTASGGTGPYSFTLASGALPPGMTLASTGLLSGTPTGGGAYTFTVRATDSTTGPDAPYSGVRTYTFNVSPASVRFAQTSLPAGRQGAAYSADLSAAGGTAPYSFQPLGGVPPGLTLSSAGVLSGTPTQAGEYSLQVRVTDASTGTGPYSAERAYPISIAGPTVVVPDTTLPPATAGSPYDAALGTPTGGQAPYTFAVVAGALPSGVSLTPDGRLTGTPTTPGSFNFTVAATDSSASPGPYRGERAYVLQVQAQPPAPPPAQIPTLTEWAMILLASVLAAFGALFTRGRRPGIAK